VNEVLVPVSNKAPVVVPTSAVAEKASGKRVVKPASRPAPVRVVDRDERGPVRIR
jgi:hypothetical protein